MSDSTTPTKLSMADLTKMVSELQAKVTMLEAKLEPKRNESQREMTDDDARRILTGDLSTVKHKDAAGQLGLSYGQVYSCRLEFTFKHIHKEMREANIKNSWVK
jgi:hypothetical protein